MCYNISNICKEQCSLKCDVSNFYSHEQMVMQSETVLKSIVSLYFSR